MWVASVNIFRVTEGIPHDRTAAEPPNTLIFHELQNTSHKPEVCVCGDEAGADAAQRREVDVLFRKGVYSVQCRRYRNGGDVKMW